MKVIPAVDIMEGKVVRLLRGKPEHVKTHDDLGDPVAVARRWEEEGAQIIHVVDLDAALGSGDNVDVIREIVETIGVPIQVGGGIRSLEKVRALLHMGVERVVLGTLPFEDPPSIEALLDEFGRRRTVVALDHINGNVVVRGWKTPTGTRVDDALSRFSRIGVELFLVTAVTRDGAMAGPDLDTFERVRRRDADLIAAGGIRGIGDLIALKRLGLYGAVVGRALYEGEFSLREALRIIWRKWEMGERGGSG
ncbi:MAG: 1-(5-phosphoribosyl)-5-[(5-phosphoribosylamino)methylideneamino]imidazole-4-carboxamide isomerase [Candidatus Bathyarchaeia archaeon]